MLKKEAKIQDGNDFTKAFNRLDKVMTHLRDEKAYSENQPKKGGLNIAKPEAKKRGKKKQIEEDKLEIKQKSKKISKGAKTGPKIKNPQDIDQFKKEN